MYTTNAIEAVNSSFRKVTKKGTFPNENALFKLLYLRIKELNNKQEKGHVPNWSMVLNQLMIDDKFKTRIDHYLTLQTDNLEYLKGQHFLLTYMCLNQLMHS